MSTIKYIIEAKNVKGTTEGSTEITIGVMGKIAMLAANNIDPSKIKVEIIANGDYDDGLIAMGETKSEIEGNPIIITKSIDSE